MFHKIALVKYYVCYKFVFSLKFTFNFRVNRLSNSHGSIATRSALINTNIKLRAKYAFGSNISVYFQHNLRLVRLKDFIIL